VVVPIYNEDESLVPLVEELHAALRPTGKNYELVLVDDGSSDGSWSLMERLADTDEALHLVRFRRNFGQTAAMQAGLDAARGKYIVTIDADLQNDPADIPMMLEKLDEGYDLVAGWRKDRKDAFLNRKLPSMIANRIISAATKVKLHDYGCTLKVMTSDVAKELRLYGEMHRFIPAVASWVGARTLELPVNHRARRFGTSKYGIGRTLRVVLDLITVRFIQQYLGRPMQVFGLGGLACLFIGFTTCGWLAVEKIAFGARLADRPLLLLGVLLIVVGLQLLSYFESQGKRPYNIRTQRMGRGSSGALAAPRPVELPVVPRPVVR
jgi:glycosyltransferase involved in cell wall biosynthesis